MLYLVFIFNDLFLSIASLQVIFPGKKCSKPVNWKSDCCESMWFKKLFCIQLSEYGTLSSPMGKSTIVDFPIGELRVPYSDSWIQNSFLNHIDSQQSDFQLTGLEHFFPGKITWRDAMLRKRSLKMKTRYNIDRQKKEWQFSPEFSLKLCKFYMSCLRSRSYSFLLRWS